MQDYIINAGESGNLYQAVKLSIYTSNKPALKAKYFFYIKGHFLKRLTFLPAKTFFLTSTTGSRF